MALQCASQLLVKMMRSLLKSALEMRQFLFSDFNAMLERLLPATAMLQLFLKNETAPAAAPEPEFRIRHGMSLKKRKVKAIKAFALNDRTILKSSFGRILNAAEQQSRQLKILD